MKILRLLVLKKILLSLLVFALILPHPQPAQAQALPAVSYLGGVLMNALKAAAVRQGIVGTGATAANEAAFNATVAASKVAANDAMFSPAGLAVSTVATIVTAPTWFAAAVAVGVGAIGFGIYQLTRPNPVKPPLITVSPRGTPGQLPPYANVPTAPVFSSSIPAGSTLDNYPTAVGSLNKLPTDAPYYFQIPSGAPAGYVNVSSTHDGAIVPYYKLTVTGYSVSRTAFSGYSTVAPVVGSVISDAVLDYPCYYRTQVDALGPFANSTTCYPYVGYSSGTYVVSDHWPPTTTLRSFIQYSSDFQSCTMLGALTSDCSSVASYLPIYSLSEYLTVFLKYSTIRSQGTRYAITQPLDDSVLPWSGKVQFLGGLWDVSTIPKNPWFVPDPNQPLYGTVPGLLNSSRLPDGNIDPQTLADLINALLSKAAAKPDYQGLPIPIAQPFVKPSDFTSPVPVKEILKPAAPVVPATGTDPATGQPYAPGTYFEPVTYTPIVPQIDYAPAPVTSTSPSSSTNPNPSATDPPPPDIGAPTLETTPTAAEILKPIFDLMPTLKGFVLPPQSGVCPVGTFDLWGKQIVMDAQCTLMETPGVASTLSAVMTAVWTIAAGIIVLGA